MATRLYIRENGTAPITPVGVDAAWEASGAPFATKPLYTTTDAGDTLTTVANFTSTTGQDRAHRRGISKSMPSGLTFDNTVTYKSYAQVFESAANDNMRSRFGLRILSEDGQTVRHTPLAVAEYGDNLEWNTALRNKGFLNGDAGAGSYTTVEGDRLEPVWGHNDSAGSSISGSSRWGSAGSADLGENETSTSTTERPWFETSLTIAFVDYIRPTGIASAEAFGTAAVDLTINPSGIASAEAFGTPTVEISTAQNIDPTGIASAEAFGMLSVDLTINPSGIASAEAFGTAVIDQPYIDVIGIASAEAFGTPTVELQGAGPGPATDDPSRRIRQWRHRRGR